MLRLAWTSQAISPWNFPDSFFSESNPHLRLRKLCEMGREVPAFTQGVHRGPQTPCSLKIKTEWRWMLQAHTPPPHNFSHRAAVKLSILSWPQACSVRREIFAWQWGFVSDRHGLVQVPPSSLAAWSSGELQSLSPSASSSDNNDGDAQSIIVEMKLRSTHHPHCM